MQLRKLLLPRRGPRATAQLQMGVALIAVVVIAVVAVLVLLDGLL